MIQYFTNFKNIKKHNEKTIFAIMVIIISTLASMRLINAQNLAIASKPSIDDVLFSNRKKFPDEKTLLFSRKNIPTKALKNFDNNLKTAKEVLQNLVNGFCIFIQEEKL